MQVDILLAQPLRLGAMAQESKVDLSRVQLLVLDEADKLFGMGFTEQVGRERWRWSLLLLQSWVCAPGARRVACRRSRRRGCP